MTTDIRIKKRTCVCYVALISLVVIGVHLSSNGSSQCPNDLQEVRSDPPIEYSIVQPHTQAQNVDSSSNKTQQCAGDRKEVRSDLPMIYAITPTYTRPVQKAELTRLAQTVMWLENFHWIIIEDSEHKTSLVENFLKQSPLHYTHLVARTKKNKILKPTEPHWMKARGVEQRNAGLSWLRDNLNDDQLNGVVFFMDDDNTYALKIFEEMRQVHKVGVWPVGLVGGMMVERPLVNPDGTKVLGFNSVWRPERPFPIDMAGFAIHLSLIKENPKAVFTHKVQAGYQESEILRQLITRDELEPLADKCTKVYVWHTRTEKPKMIEENKLRAKNSKGSNDGIEV